MRVMWLRTVFSLQRQSAPRSARCRAPARSARAGRARARSASRTPGRSTAARRRQERAHFVDPALPGRLALEQQVVAAFERHEARAGDPARRSAGPRRTARARRGWCSTSVGHDTCGSRSTTSMSLNSRMKRAAFAGEVEMRSSSLNQWCCSARAAGDELRREELAERGVLLAPAELGEAVHHLGLLALLRRRVALQPAARVAAVQDQVRHALADGAPRRRSRSMRPARCRAAESARPAPHRRRSRDRAPRRRTTGRRRPSPTGRSRARRSESACAGATARSAGGATPGCRHRTPDD